MTEANDHGFLNSSFHSILWDLNLKLVYERVKQVMK